MFDFEKLGAFYLGKRVDENTGELSDDLVLYDSNFPSASSAWHGCLTVVLRPVA
jgi:hypothetical protein